MCAHNHSNIGQPSQDTRSPQMQCTDTNYCESWVFCIFALFCLSRCLVPRCSTNHPHLLDVGLDCLPLALLSLPCFIRPVRKQDCHSLGVKMSLKAHVSEPLFPRWWRHSQISLGVGVRANGSGPWGGPWLYIMVLITTRTQFSDWYHVRRY